MAGNKTPRGKWILKMFFSNGDAKEYEYSTPRILKFVETMLLSGPVDYRTENQCLACEIVWRKNSNDV